MSESGYYPPGAEFDPSAPYNQVDVPEKEFEVTCSQSLSKTVTVTTNNYIPGASGVDYEPDDEGGCCAVGWHDPDDTSDTDWEEEYRNEHYTPLQLINLFRRYLSDELNAILNNPEGKPNKEKFLRHLIEECSDWTEDETEVVEE